MTTFRDLFTAALDPTAASGPDTDRIALSAVADLLASVAHDARSWGLEDFARAVVLLDAEVERVGRTGSSVTVRVGPGLRYAVHIYGVDAVERLCLEPGCAEQRIGTGILTAYCQKHLGTPFGADGEPDLRLFNTDDRKAALLRLDAFDMETDDLGAQVRGSERLADAVRYLWL